VTKGNRRFTDRECAGWGAGRRGSPPSDPAARAGIEGCHGGPEGRARGRVGRVRTRAIGVPGGPSRGGFEYGREPVGPFCRERAERRPPAFRWWPARAQESAGSKDGHGFTLPTDFNVPANPAARPLGPTRPTGRCAWVPFFRCRKRALVSDGDHLWGAFPFARHHRLIRLSRHCRGCATAGVGESGGRGAGRAWRGDLAFDVSGSGAGGPIIAKIPVSRRPARSSHPTAPRGPAG